MDKNKFLPVRIVCGVLFCIFSLIYFGVYQAEIMAVAQRMASGGKTHYDPVIGAILTTLVLQLLQIGLYKATQLYKRYFGLTYVPSFVVICFLSMGYDGHIGYWAWLAPLILIVWGVAVWVCRAGQSIEERYTTTGISSKVMMINLVSLFIMMLTVCLIGSKTEQQYDKAHTERVITDNVRAFTAQRDTITNPNQKEADQTLIRLLMEKKLHEFVRTLPRYYDVSEPIPHAYAEALVLNMSLTRHPQVYWKGSFDGEKVDKTFKEFVHDRSVLTDMQTKKAPSECYPLYEAFREKYRDTYWYYYALIEN